MIQQLIEREFGLLYNVHYVAELLANLGFSFQKARCVSDHLDQAKRLTWLKDTWPTFLAQAKAAARLILFGMKPVSLNGDRWATRGPSFDSNRSSRQPANAKPIRSLA